MIKRSLHNRYLKYQWGKNIKFCENYVQNHKNLKDIIEYANYSSSSSGADLSDYVLLYETIKQKKPQFVLECGTGCSTFVIAQAMLDFCQELYGDDMRLISMEHEKKWYEHQLSLACEKFLPACP